MFTAALISAGVNPVRLEMPVVMPAVAPPVSALVRTLPKSPVAIADGSARAPAVMPLVTAWPSAELFSWLAT